ncbi:MULTISPECIES: hypothetical protein [Corynebacterium]|uniref:Phage tail protein n=1 Tax=Corynebacterium hadale TaxID=2026255 RepID=A0A269PFE3_9CORY|nr:hypothetical protein [Corynebacterium hadale]PAJ70920.1 hypothetical protein CIG21_01690 [Corynebacterium hadale]WKC60820.1 hypothetical protein CHAD_09835 [Corynebacterium hadale]
MAISSYIVGPGSLTFSSPAGTFSSQITSAKVTTSSKRSDPLKVLSGEEIPGESDYTFTLEATALQDLSKSGIVDFSWKSMGKTADFTYTPNTKEGAKVSGKCVIDPISIGGDVGERATSDFSFQCLGKPSFTPKA